MSGYRRHIRKTEWEQIAVQKEEAEKNKKKRKYRKRRPSLQKYCEKKQQYAHLLEEWDYEKNNGLIPNEVKAHTQQKVWWICKNGHSWNTSVMNRTSKKGTGCPYCSGHLPIAGETDLATLNPALAEEWNYGRNKPFVPQMFTAHARAKVWWICKKGHEWRATINDRTNGSKCPFCKKKPNHPVAANQFLSKEWDYDKNALEPEFISVNSAEKVWWICKKGHSWQTAVYSRTRGSRCPYCAGKLPITGETDLDSLYPELAKEWDYNKNSLSPQDVTPGSNQKIWWRCKNGHSWQVSVNSRKKGTGCPYCAGKLPIIGETDLATARPDLVKEWNYKKNKLTPQEVTVSSGKKVWWKCQKRHSWQARISDRFAGSGCPVCRKIPMNPVPKNSILIKEWDYEKNKLIPSKVSVGSDQKVWWHCKNGHSWMAAVNSRKKGTGCPYCAGKIPIAGETDLATMCPDLVKEWDYLKNKMTPQEVSVGSQKKIWWRCQKGHSWMTMVKSRKRGSGCPYCSGKIPIAGETDLATTRPDLAKQWDYKKNELSPQDVSAGSGRKIWWRCQKGHSWMASVKNRNSGNGCPYCSGKIPIAGETDLGTLRPNIVREWDFEKNDLAPCDVTVRSEKKVWWKCVKGHNWQARISDRSNGTGCPICQNQSIHVKIKPVSRNPAASTERHDLRPVHSDNSKVDGFMENGTGFSKKSLNNTYPDLALEWDYSKNELAPQDVSAGSGKKVWWICAKGHSWLATVNSRSHGRGCPYCSGLIPFPGETDLATVCPALVKEWDFEKNTISPQSVTSGSEKKVWWRCKEGHSWMAAVVDRKRKRGCPYCAGKMPNVGKTDLATICPDLLKEWDYQKNELNPQDVAAGSHKKVWWVCKEGHSWMAEINSRKKGSGCPYCTGRKPIIGKTDLASVRPDLGKEWDYQKNELTPQDVTIGSSKKVWWICAEGHSWQARINDRSKSKSCPICQKLLKIRKNKCK